MVRKQSEIKRNVVPECLLGPKIVLNSYCTKFNTEPTSSLKSGDGSMTLNDLNF